MDQPLVSIIIPCYNGALFIEKAIYSVLNQTYERIECIVIDDGSKDNSSEIIQQITKKDQRVLYKYQENKGLSGARNSGLILSNGRYIYFLDADDLLPTNAISDLLNLADGDIDIVYGKTATTNGQNETAINYLEHHPPTNQVFTNENYSLFTLITEHTITGVAHNRLFTKDFLDKNDLKFKEGILHEDELWFFETLFHANQIILGNTVTYFYNVNNDGSIMSTYTLKHLEHYLSIIRVFYNSYYSKLDNEKSRVCIASYMTRIKIVIATFWLYQFEGVDKSIAYEKTLETFKATKTIHEFENLSKPKKKLYTIFNKMVTEKIKDAQFYFKYHKSKRIKKRIQAYILARNY